MILIDDNTSPNAIGGQILIMVFIQFSLQKQLQSKSLSGLPL